VPSSILRKEILPAIANSNYLAKHDMEWVGRRVRQRPGHKMHWVSEICFNSHIILCMIRHQKTYREQRAFSHGCIRLARPRDLAIEILKDDKNWTAEKIDIA
jgi:murein L,D-transpeptidase YcbB/YkuD